MRPGATFTFRGFGIQRARYIDVFDPPLHGLVLAETEFTTDEDMRTFEPPENIVAEVTDDPRFTGGQLVQAHRTELISWLNDYGIKLNPDY
ncbi:CYTH domain-containing protein [Actinacidiphila soli]|uniref:hypothetical protein n=1 Tax=Actinacidiphila soli TaxID=2487275 RepID=UPI000FCCC69B|nr:hypothetical protein [Actinacidiphila soli]